MYTIVKKLIIFTIVVATSFVILGNHFMNNRAWNLLMTDFVEEKNIQVSHFFENEYADLQDLIESHAVWTDAIDYLNNSDEDWLYDNATGYLINDYFNVDYLFISNETQTFQQNYGIIIDPSEITNLFQSALNNNTPTQGIFWIDNELYILISTPFYDNKHENPEGAFIVGRHIDERELASLSELLDANNITNISLSSDYVFSDVITTNYQNIDLSIPVTSSTDTFYVNLSFSLPVYGYLFQTQQKHLGATLIFFSILVILITLSFIKNISRSLNNTILAVNFIAVGNFKEKLTLNKNKLIPELSELSYSINKMSDEIEEKISQIDDKYLQMINLISTAAAINDAYTHQHNNAVAEKSIELAKLINYKDLKNIELAGKFHDIGKIATPTQILNKPGRLTDEEFTTIKEHPSNGYELIKNTDFNQSVKDGVLYHHEKYDGSGYPKGLKGDEIPLIAQIISIADVYDALTSDRPYRKSMTKEKAIEILIQGKGTSFNPELVDNFIKLL